MLFENGAGSGEAAATGAGERQYSVAVFGQTGEEIGQWDRCTELREEPGRVSFTDDRDHLVIIRGGIVVLQEQ